MQSLCTFVKPSYTSCHTNLTHTADELNRTVEVAALTSRMESFLGLKTAEIIFTIAPTYLPVFY